jgi:cell division control protein 24
LVTVEIDQATLIRNNTAPANMTGGDSMLSIGTPSIVPASQSVVGSPTASIMSTPTLNDNIINKKADPAQGLYQTCLTLRERLRDVPDFEKFLEPPEDADPSIPEDPVTQLWRCFRMGSSLCVLFNATRPVELIRDDRLSPSLKTVNDCKAATFHFLKGIKQELDIQGDDAFMIHNLYSDDTNGFVKVRDYRPVPPPPSFAQADENTGGQSQGLPPPRSATAILTRFSRITTLTSHHVCFR